MAAGADRHHHLAAVDDRRKHEGGQVGAVDHIHRDAGVARAGGNLFVALVAGRAHHRDRAGKTRRQRIVEIDFELARTGRGLHDLIGNIGMAGIPAHRGVRRAQQPKLGDGCSPEPTSATGPLVTSRNTGRKRIANCPESLCCLKRNSTGRFKFRNEKNRLSYGPERNEFSIYLRSTSARASFVLPAAAARSTRQMRRSRAAGSQDFAARPALVLMPCQSSVIDCGGGPFLHTQSDGHRRFNGFGLRVPRSSRRRLCVAALPSRQSRRRRRRAAGRSALPQFPRAAARMWPPSTRGRRPNAPPAPGCAEARRAHQARPGIAGDPRRAEKGARDRNRVCGVRSIDRERPAQAQPAS